MPEHLSGEDFFNNMPMHIGEPEAATLEWVDQPPMVDAQ